MTSTGCGQSVLRCPDRISAGGDEHLVGTLLPERGFEHLPPTRHVRVPAQQSPPLPLGHASPDTEFDPVVQSVGQAFVADRAAAADPLRHVLLGALHEQRVRVATLTCRLAGPVADHSHLSTSPLASPTPGDSCPPE